MLRKTCITPFGGIGVEGGNSICIFLLKYRQGIVNSVNCWELSLQRFSNYPCSLMK